LNIQKLSKVPNFKSLTMSPSSKYLSNAQKELREAVENGKTGKDFWDSWNSWCSDVLNGRQLSTRNHANDTNPFE